MIKNKIKKTVRFKSVVQKFGYGDDHDEFKLDTQEDIEREEQKLLSELKELNIRMKRGEDVTQQFKQLNDKFELIKEIDKMIKMQNEFNSGKNQQDNRVNKSHQHSSLKTVSKSSDENSNKDRRTRSSSSSSSLLKRYR